MAGVLMGDPSHHGMVERSPQKYSHDRAEDADRTGSSWYLSRREIEENSPSRRDGIDLKKETHIRKSYCTFLQELGQKLKVPQVTIATAIVFCHRFFLRQSLAKNDRRTVATVCMFLAGKVEETPRPLKDVILVAYEIIHKKSSEAVQKRIKQKEVYEQEKEVILLAERVVLATLGCDFNVNHPYKPLVAAIKKFKAIDSDKDLPRVAWNFVNDGLRTSLCLQFESHHIAAGAIFLAAKFLKVKLPSDGDRSWWQEFDVTPRQLEEVSNQMLEMYEQYPAVPPPHGNETRGRPAAGARQNASVKAPRVAEEPCLGNGHASSPNPTGVQHGTQTNSTCSAPDQSFLDKLSGTQKTARNEDNGHDRGNKEPRLLPEGVFKNHEHHELGNLPEASSSKSNHVTGHSGEELGLCVLGGTANNLGAVQSDVKGPAAMKKIDKNNLKAAMVKRRESQADGAGKEGILDGDDTIRRDLEKGFELTADDEPLRDESQYMDLQIEDKISRTEMVNAGEGKLLADSRDAQSPESDSKH